MKTYALALLWLIAVAVVFGAVGPAMVSAPDTGTVALGFGLIAVALPLLYVFTAALYLDIRAHFRKKEGVNEKVS